MKTLITLLLSTVFVLLSAGLSAQEIQKGNPGMWPAFVKYTTNAPAFNKSSIAIVDAAGKQAGIKNGIVKNIEKDVTGMQHFRYQQTLNGIAIENADMLVHVANGKIKSQNGEWIKDFPAGLQSAPVLAAANALNKALQNIGASKYKWELPAEEAFLKREQNNPNATFYPKATLVYYSGERDVIPSALRLAYKFDVYAQDPIGRQLIFVDAINGKILGKRELIHETNATGTAQTGYSGTQTITTDFTGATYRLRETGRGAGINTYNLLTGTNYAAAVDFTDADNSWNNINVAKDEYATDAHWGTEMTYDYYFQKYGRNSIDGLGMALNSYVHYSSAYFNAFWDGNRMTYGDGDVAHGNKPLTSLDVCGHEITHGVTERTSALVYSYESGAMNEGFSDIFGTAIEAFARPTNTDWLIGGDFYTIRSMSNPNAFNQPDTYGGTYWYTGGGDNGGVHTNSGVLNYWFYLLTVGGSGINDHGTPFNVTGVGMDTAAAIAYALNTAYLTATSDYYAARQLGILAAENLYGIGSNAAIQTANAWTAVGLYAATCPASSGLNAVNVLDRSATVKWTADPGATYYNVQFKTNAVSTWSSVITTTADSMNLGGLTASILYDYRVRSSCNGAYTAAQFTTAAPICNGPGGISFVTSSSSAVLNWSPQWYAVSYDVEYKLPADNVWTVAGNTTATTFTITGLTAPTTYDCRIKNNCSFGSSPYSEFQFTTTLTPCDAPTGLVFSYNNNISTFTWNAVPGAVSYSIDLAWAGGQWGEAYDVTTTNSYSFVNLMQGGNFQFHVITNCTGGNSLPSSTLLFTTPCSAPGGLTTTNISYTSATLNWIPAAVNNNNTAFGVYYRLANTNNAWISLGSTTASTKNVTGLTQGTLYEWKVRKLCSALNSPDVISQFSTLAAPVCNAPTGIATSGITASQATFTWAAVSGAVSYNVQYKPATSSTWSAAVNTVATNYGVSGLTSSTLYDWRVGTVCSLNSSAYSSAQFTTSTISGCNVPTGLNTTGIGNTGAVLNWAAVSGANSYRLQYKTAAATTWTVVTNINTTGYTLSNLAMSTVYQFAVSSKCGSTFTAYSPVSSFTTLNCVTSANNTAQWIDLFKVGTINRVSGADAGGYVNTGLSTNLLIGSTANAGQISAGFSGAVANNNYNVYIDFNRNGSFNESNERVFGAALISNAGTFNFSFNIPATATPGVTGLRVVMRKNTDGPPGPCIQGFVGEAEDYLVNLTTTAFQGFGINPVTVAEVKTPTEDLKNNAGITVGPNPSTGIYNVSFNSGYNPVQYDIINTNGLAVKSARVVSAKNLQLDITSMPAGLYLLRLTDRSGKNELLKLVKE
jgi:Zn-dependent metalloprotease